MAGTSNYGMSQTSPFQDQPQANNPAYQAGQRRRIQGQANIGQAIQGGGIPIGGTSPFAGAAQTLGQGPQQSTQPMPVSGGSQIPPVGTVNTPQASGTTPQQGAVSAAPGGSSGSNVDKFMSMLSDPQYSSNPQAAVDAFNKLGLGADSTGLSSNYGSSPAVYDGGNTIGLPDRYMTKNSDGTWTTTMRGPGGGGNSGGSGFNSNIINNAIAGSQLGSSAVANSGGDPSAIWQSILSQLQKQPQLQ